MSDKADFEFDAIQDRDMTLRQLRALLEGLEAGQLDLAVGDEQTSLVVGDILDLGLRAQQDGARVRLQLELQWRVPGAASRPELRVGRNSTNTSEAEPAGRSRP